MARQNKNSETRSEQEAVAQVGGKAGGVNFAADIVRQDNVPSTLNFSRELVNVQQAEVPSEGDVDPNEYANLSEEDQGFARNPVAGGSVPNSATLGDFVNGVDHVEDESEERVDERG